MWFRRALVAVVVMGCGGLPDRVAGEDDPIGPDEGRPHVLWQDADSCVGRAAFVYGTIAAVGHANGIHFLNFDAKRRDVFKAVVFSRSLEKFPTSLDELYAGKTVRIRGYVSRYRGSPEIQVASPGQIAILDQLPALPPAASPLPIEPPVAAGTIRIATFNVENLFDNSDDPYTNDDSAEPKPRPKLEQLAASIRTLQADVLALQEVESRGYLERFVEVFLADQGYRHIVQFEGNDIRGIDVALLSKLAIGKVVSHRHLSFQGADGKPQRFSRDVLTVEIQPTTGRPFEVWVLHLKSNSDGRQYAEPVRLAEAAEVRRLLNERLSTVPQPRIVVCGDLNDTPESETVKSLTGEGAAALQSAWQEIPTTEQISYHREPYRSLIDFIFWSPALAGDFVPKSYRVIAQTTGEPGSDHFPVVAEFEIRK